MDTADTTELEHLGLTKEVPTPRAFMGSTMIPEIGAGYITGGMTNTGVGCDIWGLRVDKLVSFNSNEPLSSFWIKKVIQNPDKDFLCRENHSMALVSKDTFVVYGGLDQYKQFNKKPYTFDTIKFDIEVLEVTGDEPEPRIRQGVVSSGGGMVILYGGAHLQGKGYYIDLWHFIVSNGKIQFKQITYQQEGDNLFMTWRHGFTMHYVRGMQDPVLIGGTYGNNQQSRALVTLPEQKCKDISDVKKAQCSP